MALCAESKVRVAATRALPVSGLRGEVPSTTAVSALRVALEARRSAGKVAHATAGALPVSVSGCLLTAAVGVAGCPFLLLEFVAATVLIPAVRLAFVVGVVVATLLLLLFLPTFLLLTLHAPTENWNETKKSRN